MKNIYWTTLSSIFGMTNVVLIKNG